MDLCSALLSVTAPPQKQDPRAGSLEIQPDTSVLPLPPQLPSGDGLFRDQHGFPQLLHQPRGSVLCQQEIQELLPGGSDPSRAPGCHQAQGHELILFLIPNYPLQVHQSSRPCWGRLLPEQDLRQAQNSLSLWDRNIPRIHQTRGWGCSKH